MCNKLITRADNLKRHIREEHKVAFSNTNYKREVTHPYKCSNCGLSYTRKFKLDKHITSKHNAAKSEEPICEICMKPFPDIKTMRKHANRVHNKDSDVQECALCSKAFGRKDNLVKHIKNCH